MIDFRYFLVSLTAVFLALAVGVALGAGPLRGDADQQLRANLREAGNAKDGLRKEVDRLQQVDAYRDSFAGEVAPDLVHGKLESRRIVLVALPDADQATVKDLRDTLTSAGGTITGTVEMKSKWAQSNERQFLEDLADRLLAGDSKGADSGSAYDLAGSVLASALVSKDAKAVGHAAQATPTIMGGFGEGGVVDGETDLPRADLAVLVAPTAGRGTPTSEDTANEAWVALARSLDEAGSGVVVAGDESAARRGGLLESLREDSESRGTVSSVDVADLPSGQIAVVWALAEQKLGGSGHYGTVGTTDGPLPEPDDA